MSVIVIGGGGDVHANVTRLIVVYPHATAGQKARILSLLQDFRAQAAALVEEVDSNSS